MEAETPLPPRRARTRARIRNAALELFSERGFGGASMRDVATRVGCTAAALYYHFDGKDALLVDLVGPFLDDVDALLEGGGGTSARETLGDYLDCLLAHAEVVRLLQRDVAVRCHPAVAPRHEALLARLEGRLAGGRDGAATAARVSASLGALRGPVLQPEIDAGALRDVVLEASLRALGPVPAASP